MALLVALWAEAYSAMVALSTIALYASYAMPILVSLRSNNRRKGPWSLRHSRAVNLIALAWIAVCILLFSLLLKKDAGIAFAACVFFPRSVTSLPSV